MPFIIIVAIDLFCTYRFENALHKVYQKKIRCRLSGFDSVQGFQFFHTTYVHSLHIQNNVTQTNSKKCLTIVFSRTSNNRILCVFFLEKMHENADNLHNFRII